MASQFILATQTLSNCRKAREGFPKLQKEEENCDAYSRFKNFWFYSIEFLNMFFYLLRY
jgi:hypothetical protein